MVKLAFCIVILIFLKINTRFKISNSTIIINTKKT